MPSLLRVSSKLTPAAAPPAGSGYAIELTASSVRRKAWGVEMSGLGAPSRTATPTETLANGVALLATTLPEAITSRYGGCTMETSKASPRTTCCLVPAPEPNVAFTFIPVSRSKPGVSCSMGALMPPGATRETSRWVWAGQKLPKLKASGIDHASLFMMCFLADETERCIRDDIKPATADDPPVVGSVHHRRWN